MVKVVLTKKKIKRDLVFSAVAPFDWELGFDIELLLGFRAICSSAKIFFGIRGRNGWGVDRYREIVKEVKEKNIKPFKIPVKKSRSFFFLYWSRIKLLSISLKFY